MALEEIRLKVIEILIQNGLFTGHMEIDGPRLAAIEGYVLAGVPSKGRPEQEKAAA